MFVREFVKFPSISAAGRKWFFEKGTTSKKKMTI